MPEFEADSHITYKILMKVAVFKFPVNCSVKVANAHNETGLLVT